MEARLRQAVQRAEEVERLLADPAVAKDPAQLQSLGREHARLAPVVRLADRLARLERELEQARELADEADPGLAALARPISPGSRPRLPSSRPTCTSCWFRATRTTTGTPSWRSGPGPAAMKPPCLRPTSI